ncbi:hypothetical protein EV356DRAFT_571457 [Viridothelium virens]|uniref:Uncharacterized protein n=1 Tax=Viridothelium virens TaxID=1048519 RepID=A0A6A6GU05_VIRVR|nr:hypothetical protein EV356DRAFT_571457 [Viridothelium virens]
MTRILLFCIAEEAKTFIHKALAEKHHWGPWRVFWLVESHTLPSDNKGFKSELNDDETFETEFIGASEEDCQKWALEKRYQVNFIDQRLIAIADARSARDDTLLIQFCIDSEPFEIEPYGALPRDRNAWYSFRIDHSKADLVAASLTETEEEITFPVYFERKEELTDENGVFNVDKAELLVAGKDPDLDTL